MAKMFDGETNASTDDSSKAKTQDELCAEKMFKDNLVFEDGRYYVLPLFKKDYIPMLNNYNIAFKRYKSLRRQLAKNPELEKSYGIEIRKIIDNGVVEKVNESKIRAADPDRFVSYIPHLCIERKEKATSKVRPVFDASSKNNQDVSLNNNIYPGPKMQKSISHLNIHMRLAPVVLLSDLEKMFYQIGYQKEPPKRTKLENTRDAFRFLWSDNAHEDPEVYRFCKMLIGCRCSPFQSNSVIEHHLDHLINTNTDDKIVAAAKLLKQMMYADDVITALNSIDDAILMRKTIVTIFEGMGMRLTKFVTNSPDVLETIPENERGPTKEIEFNPAKGENSVEEISQPTKVVGLCWDPEKDVFSFTKCCRKLMEKDVFFQKEACPLSFLQYMI